MAIRLGSRSLLLLMLVAIGVAPAQAAARERSLTIRVTLNSVLGASILVDSAGFPLYHDVLEKRGRIHCVGACAQYWLPLLTTRRTKLVAGPGVKASELGTIKRPNGAVQVTYDGLALYRFSGDAIPGQANGQGAHRVWFVITAAGAVTTAGTAGPAATNRGGAAPGYGY